MWFTIVTFTTVGFGDMVPVTTLGIVFGCGQFLVGLLTVTLPATILQSNFYRIYSQVEQYQQKTKQQEVLANPRRRQTTQSAVTTVAHAPGRAEAGSPDKGMTEPGRS